MQINLFFFNSEYLKVIIQSQLAESNRNQQVSVKSKLLQEDVSSDNDDTILQLMRQCLISVDRQRLSVFTYGALSFSPGMRSRPRLVRSIARIVLFDACTVHRLHNASAVGASTQPGRYATHATGTVLLLILLDDSRVSPVINLSTLRPLHL